MGATRPASGKIKTKGSQIVLIALLSVSLCVQRPDAGRVAPIRGSVCCLRLVLAFCVGRSFSVGRETGGIAHQASRLPPGFCVGVLPEELPPATMPPVRSVSASITFMSSVTSERMKL